MRTLFLALLAIVVSLAQVYGQTSSAPTEPAKSTAPSSSLTKEDRAELVKDFDATRAQEIAFLTETKEDLRSHFEDNPVLKTMDAWQWLIFNGAHSKRHTAQILEVKADPNFPKS